MEAYLTLNLLKIKMQVVYLAIFNRCFLVGLTQIYLTAVQHIKQQTNYLYLLPVCFLICPCQIVYLQIISQFHNQIWRLTYLIINNLWISKKRQLQTQVKHLRKMDYFLQIYLIIKTRKSLIIPNQAIQSQIKISLLIAYLLINNNNNKIYLTINHCLWMKAYLAKPLTLPPLIIIQIYLTIIHCLLTKAYLAKQQTPLPIITQIYLIISHQILMKAYLAKPPLPIIT